MIPTVVVVCAPFGGSSRVCSVRVVVVYRRGLLPTEIETVVNEWLRSTIDPLLASSSSSSSSLVECGAGPLPPGVSPSLLHSAHTRAMLVSLRSSLPPLVRRLREACHRQSSGLHAADDKDKSTTTTTTTTTNATEHGKPSIGKASPSKQASPRKVRCDT